MSVNVSAIVAAHTRTVKVTADNSAAVAAFAAANGLSTKRISKDVGVLAENAGATVELPHDGFIVVHGDESTPINRAPRTVENAADSAGIHANEVTAVINPAGEIVELPHRATPAPVGPATYEVVLNNGDTFEYTGPIKGAGVQGVAKSLDVHPADIATINGRAVVVEYRLARG